MDLTSEARVDRKVSVSDPQVAAQGSVCRKNALQTTDIHAGGAQSTVGQHTWPFVSALEIAVSIPDGENVERTARSDLDDRRERKASQERF